MVLAFVLVFAIGLIIGLPIIVVLGASTIVPHVVNPAFPANMSVIMRAIFSGVDSSTLLVMPLFVLSGEIMTQGGISRRLFDFFTYLVGRFRGGVPCAVVLTCLFYGAISGSAIATCVAVGTMTLPILKELGYDRTFSGALVATAGGLGIIIPPSTPMVVYANVTGTSITEMFEAGIIPGCLLAVLLMVYVVYYCRTKGEDTEKVRANFERIRAKGFWTVFKESFFALLCPVIVLGSIYSGIITPSEAATVSVFYALLVGLFAYRSVGLYNIVSIIKNAVHSSAPTLFILALAGATGKVMAFLKLTNVVTGYATTYVGSRFAILMLINIVIFLLGMVVPSSPVTVILGPLFCALGMAYGVDPVQMGIIMTMGAATAFVSPPYGVNLFIMSSSLDVPVMALAKKAIPMIIASVIALILVSAFPSLSMLFIGR